MINHDFSSKILTLNNYLLSKWNIIRDNGRDETSLVILNFEGYD